MKLRIEYDNFIVFSEEFATIADFKDNIIEVISKISDIRIFIMCSNEISWNTYRNLVSGNQESAMNALNMVLWSRQHQAEQLEKVIREQKCSRMHE